ncbi:MAG TPA: hypothetical protein VGR00_12600 [Thermoanaerobaculia bacterium]|nr:hypothetical protein [Thermoanaerobaculia bacterium]
MNPYPFEARTAVVVAHPGHELRVHGLVERVRPLVFVLTDGSGRSGRSRLAYTSRLLSDLGAPVSPVFGRFTDLELYRAMLDGRVDVFLRLAEEIAERLVSEGIEVVVTDDAEGYNPAHDVCRFLADAAASLAASPGHGALSSYAFAVVGPPAGDVTLTLDDTALRRKLDAARRYEPLAGEVAAELEKKGVASFRVERFRKSRGPEAESSREVPFYESYGERQVAAGFYERVLRHDEHVLPIRQALRACSSKGAILS